MLKEMEYVYKVYQERSFSRAANKLFISQPALSSAIKKVENEIGLPLFDRSTAPISMTPAGEYYIHSVEKIMLIQKDMENYFRQLSQRSRGLLSIGSSTYCCTYVLPDIVQKFLELHPDVTVNIIEASSVDLIKQLRDGDLHIILDAGSTMQNIFREIPFREETVLLSVPSEYSVNEGLSEYQLTPEQICSGVFLSSEYPAVPLEKFSEEPFLFLKKGNDMFNRGSAMCQAAGFTPRVSMYVDQMLTSYYLSCEKRGIAFVRADIITHVERTRRICLYKIDSPLATRRLTFSYKNQNKLLPVLETFIQFIMPYTIRKQ